MKRKAASPLIYPQRLIIAVCLLMFIFGLYLGLHLVSANTEQQPLLHYECPKENRMLLDTDTPLSVADITAFLGFQHPAFERLMQVKWDYPYILEIKCAVYNNRAYLALYYRANEYIQIYEIEESNPKLVYEINTLPPSFVDITAFADRNFNGLPDIALRAYDYGNGHCPSGGIDSFILLERHNNGIWSDIAPKVTLVELSGFGDVDGDDIPELSGSKFYYLPKIETDCQRYVLSVSYGWDGHDYSKIVAVRIGEGFKGPNIYDDLGGGFHDRNYEISSDLQNLTCDTINSEHQRQFLSATLLYYYAWGRLDQGWQMVQPIIDAALACDNSSEVLEFVDTIFALRSYFAELK